VGEEVKVGSLHDMTGATSDVGADMALGMGEAATYWTDQGGINGRTLKVIMYDYGYRVPEAVTTYKRFRDYDKVVLVQGWGTGDTEALTPTINKDKMVYFSCSFSGHLCDPAKTPYNYVYGTDYSTNARAALQYWYDNYWLKDPRYADVRNVRSPRFCFFGSFGTPYSTAPREAIKDQAKLLGMDTTTCVDQDVSLWALEAKSQILAVSANPPDVVWHGNTTMSVATTIKDFYALGLTGPGLKTMHLVNNWGFDENLIALGGAAVEETIAPAASAYFLWDYPKAATVHEYAARINPGIAPEKRLVRTVQAWLKLSMTVKVLKTMDNDGVLDVSSAGLAHTRELCQKYFETCSPFESSLDYGVVPRVYTATDHRPGSEILISQVSGGKIVDRGTMDMKALYPDLWDDWLGW
jgi:branched-chain amino acid transport system substrate-binding protein